MSKEQDLPWDKCHKDVYDEHGKDYVYYIKGHGDEGLNGRFISEYEILELLQKMQLLEEENTQLRKALEVFTEMAKRAIEDSEEEHLPGGSYYDRIEDAEIKAKEALKKK